MKKISVIIPIYNTVEYIKRCLKSVCLQTYTNLEIICIDDGSTDGTEKVVNELAQKDPRIIFIRQKNAGESVARNVGLKYSTGDYIGFVDCDDWIETNMYESLIRMAEKYDADISACSYCKESNSNTQIMTNLYPVPVIFDRDQLLNYVYHRDWYRGVSGYIWCKLFRRDLIIVGNELRHCFDETIHFGGDVLFFAQTACDAKTVTYNPKAYYHYFQRETSTAHTEKISVWNEFLDAYYKVICYLTQQGICNDTLEYVIRFRAYWASKVAEKAIMLKDHENLGLCQRIMFEYQEIYERKNAEYPERIKQYRYLLEYHMEELSCEMEK